MFTVFGKPVFSLCRWTNWKYPHCLKKHSVKRFTNETPHIYTLERITGSSCKQNSVIVILSNAFYKALHGYVTKGVEPPSYQEIKKKKHEATCLQRNHQLWITFSVRAHNFIEVWKYSKWFWMRFCCLKSKCYRDIIDAGPHLILTMMVHAVSSSSVFHLVFFIFKSVWRNLFN